MSKCENSVSLSLSSPQILREKPQRGMSGKLFMKRKTGGLVHEPMQAPLELLGISDVIPVAEALSVWESGSVAVAPPPLPPAGPTCFAMESVRARASAPVMRATGAWPCIQGNGEGGESAWGGETGPTHRMGGTAGE